MANDTPCWTSSPTVISGKVAATSRVLLAENAENGKGDGLDESPTHLKLHLSAIATGKEGE
jgi:hypothetical protein